MVSFAPANPEGRDTVGVVDLGSNSVRLVVYEGGRRIPMPLFNEKETCALGRTLDETGRMDPDGVVLAHRALGRFTALAGSMGVQRLDILGTAAVREATDGPHFCRDVERRFGVPIRILSGEEEAQLAAAGVLCGKPEADGLVADLGGGSLDLVDVGQGRYGAYASFQLGVLRLMERAGKKPKRVAGLIDDAVKTLDWMGDLRGRNVYAVGGTWRAVARACMAESDYPLQVLDNFSLDRDAALSLLATLARRDPDTLRKVDGISKRRAQHVPFGAAALHKLVEATQPERLVFSIYGMREGWFFENLPHAMQMEDPLISLARGYEEHFGRFPGAGAEMAAWTDGLFADDPPGLRRLRHAAGYLADSFWAEHPDYRAEQAFLRTLRLPFMGLDHRDRACLALAVLVRYKGDVKYKGDAKTDLAKKARDLIDEERTGRATRVGLTLRLGYTLTGGVPGLLRRTRIARESGRLVLYVPAGEPAFTAGTVHKALDKLARTMNLESEIRAIAEADTGTG